MTTDNGQRTTDKNPKPKIVTCGMPPEVVSHLRRRLGQVMVKAARNGGELLEILDAEELPLLILDGSVENPSAIEVLHEIRRTSRIAGACPDPAGAGEGTAVVYCLHPDTPGDLPRTLVRDHGVRRVLFHPLDLEELSREAASILGVPLFSGFASRDLGFGIRDSETLVSFPGPRNPKLEIRSPKPDRSKEILAGIANAWGRLAPIVAERLELLEQAGLALLEGKLSRELRQQAECEAHKLAGLLGTVGFAAGSRFALEMEHILQRGTRQSQAYALRFSELVVAARLELEKTPVPRPDGVSGSAGQQRVAQGSLSNPAAFQEPADQADRTPSLLIAVPDSELAERLALEAVSRGMRVETVAGLDAAWAAVATAAPSPRPCLDGPVPTGSRQVSGGFARPDVVLLDLTFPEGPEQGLRLLAELSARTPAVPVLVLTARDGLTDRVEVARCGGRGFLSKSLPPGQILEAVADLFERLRTQHTKVMAVDDDPSILLALRALLEPRGIALTTLDDPLRFWEVLAESSPELLVLDVEMPHLSGIELCRVVRNDASRAALPVIFLTAHTDADTIHRVFAAGADDFVSKPIVGPELVTRVFNRLERSRLQRSLLEIDSLTGVPNRRKSASALEQFLRLAGRHDQPLSLGVVTLDRFREINTESGHAAADEVLRYVGQLLSRTFRSEDIVGRWGGGEFVVGMYGLSRYDGVQRLAEVLEALRPQRFRSAAGAEFHMTFSAGIAEYPEDGADLQALYRAAEEAARQATGVGGDRVLPVGWTAEQQRNLGRVDVALVMGDEAEASLMLDSFKTRGYRARWLRNGKQAARALAGSVSKLKARVIVLDADVPGLDGLELLRCLSQDESPSRSRVIMVTAPSVADDVAAALKLGAFDHVAKPFNLPVLVQHVRRALEACKEDGDDAGRRVEVGPSR